MNVGATWLWYFQNFLSFDLGHRVEGFRKLTGEDAEYACDEVARRAAREVETLRERIPDLEAVAREQRVFEQRVLEARALWPLYHGAIAEALTGRSGEARRLLETITSPSDEGQDAAWVLEMRARASRLLSLVGNASAFAEEIKATIHQTRRALRLPEWEGTLPQR